MSFLLFASRKIQIRRELNAKNYELDLITQQYNDATKKVAEFQQNMTNAKQMTSVFTSGFQAQQTAIALKEAFKDSPEKYQAYLNGGNKADGTKLSTEDWNRANAACQQASQAAAMMTSAVTNVTDSIFSAMNKAQGAKLQAQQQQLDMRKQALESEVQVLSNEYNSVKEAEQSEAKNVVPQFGLA